MVGRDLPKCWQYDLDAERLAEGGESRLATFETLGHQADERDEGGMHHVEASPGPTDGAGQFHVVPADHVCCGLNGADLFDLIDDMLEVVQCSGEPRSKTVGKQAEALLTFGAIPARNTCSRRIESGVRADVAKTAAAARMPGTSIKSCRLPRFLANVFLAGEAKFPTKLHRPRPARGKPWRATFLSCWWPGAPTVGPQCGRSSAGARSGYVTGKRFHRRASVGSTGRSFTRGSGPQQQARLVVIGPTLYTPIKNRP